MDNITIEKILKQNNKYNTIRNSFLGVFPRDKLPQVKKLPACFILNTQPSSEPGEHWLAFYIDDKNVCDFFDSYGNSPSRFGLDNYLDKFKSSYWSKAKIQGMSSNCGLYCILFLLYKSQNRMREFYLEFNKTAFLNDKKLIYLIKSLK